ncbi:hypothetical protein ACFQ7A_20985 [Streptomyces sp. NPDC056528]|uniref:hypothetical protein n=1 Tax=Streptomyces sp. NPDC056528 TaxID=3345854 RepID=UPI0036A6BB32
MDIETTEKTGPAERTEPTGQDEQDGKVGRDGKDGGAAKATTTGDRDGDRDGDLDGDRAVHLDGRHLSDDPDADLDADPDDDEAAPAGTDTGVGAGAAAVVSAALGAVALTGTWAGKVVSERETLVGQIKTSGSGTPTQQISEIYGDAWHSTALVNGVFALIALIVAVAVLVLPRRPAWVRAVAVAGAVLGGLGLLLSAGTYFDLFLSLPTAGS